MRTWPTPFAPWRWTRSKRPNPAIPACRWAWPMSRRCCSRASSNSIPADPAWPDRDRFVLSAGHGSMLLYALLYLPGYEDMSSDELKTSGSGARTRRAIPNMAIRPASRPPPVRSARVSPPPSAWRSPSACWPRASATISSITITYVIAGDGCLMEGHQPRGDLSRRPSAAQPADRAVRRQPHLHRRRDIAVHLGRPARALRGAGWSACRIDGHDPEAIAARDRQARRQRPAFADRLPHDHRFWRADPAGHRKGAWRAARRRGNRRTRASAGLAACALRDPGRCR